MHAIEMLAMGNDMRRQAEARCLSVNEAHFMVHEAMLETMVDPAVVSARTAHDLLFARLDAKLTESATARACRWID